MSVNKYPFPEQLSDAETAKAITAHTEQIEYIFMSLVSHYGELTTDCLLNDLFSSNKEVYEEARLVANHVLSCIMSS